MRTASGRKVTGKLVQDPETGYWKEEVTDASRNRDAQARRAHIGPRATPLDNPARGPYEDFVRASYVRCTNPRRFIVLGIEYHAGDFAAIASALYGNGHDQPTFYKRDNAVLLGAHLECPDKRTDAATGTTDTVAHFVEQTPGFDAQAVAARLR